MKIKVILVFLLGVFFSLGAQAKYCKKGQPCGNSCISWNKTCHIGTKSNTYKPSYSKKSKALAKTNNDINLSGMYVVTASKLNVRDNPFSSKNIVGQLQKGQEIYVHSFVREWAMIRYKGDFSWVSGKYIKFKY